ATAGRGGGGKRGNCPSPAWGLWPRVRLFRSLIPTLKRPTAGSCPATPHLIEGGFCGPWRFSPARGTAPHPRAAAPRAGLPPRVLRIVRGRDIILAPLQLAPIAVGLLELAGSAGRVTCRLTFGGGDLVDIDVSR